MHRDLGRPIGTLFVGVALCLAGCAGSGAEKEHTIAQLRYTKQRLDQSLREATNREAKLKKDVESLRARNKSLRLEVAGTESRLRLASEKLEAITKKHQELQDSVRVGQDQSTILENRLAKARAIASSTAGELADLRVQKEDLERKVKALRARNSKVASERDALAKEAADVRVELARNRAVVRSLTEGGEDREKARIATLVEKVERLERENTQLEERAREAARRSATGNATASSGPPVVVAAGAKDFGPVFKARFAQLANGQFSWDAFDFTAFGVAALVLFLVVWALVRGIQRRRMVAELAELHDHLDELEQELDRSQGRGQPEPRVAPPRAASARPRGFSAVIARQPDSEEVKPQPQVAEEEEDFDADAAPTMMLDPLEDMEMEEGSQSEAEAETERGSRKVIGARTWQDDGADASAEEMANTQIIPRVSEEDLEDEPAGEERDERELLAELKAAINRKCDEMVQ